MCLVIVFGSLYFLSLQTAVSASFIFTNHGGVDLAEKSTAKGNALTALSNMHDPKPF